LSSHWRRRERDKRAWQEELNFELHRAKLPTCDRIEAQVTFRFSTRHRRDTGNYSSTLEKCLGDALRPDFIPDDDSSRFRVTDARISSEVGPAETIIVLDWERSDEVAA
jgi:hypothetical protein